MPVLDTEALLQPISPEAPCGPDLEYDPAFAALETLARVKPAEECRRDDGSMITIPAKEPDWRSVRAESEALFRRSKDLRTAAYLALACVREHGYPGLCDSLRLFQGLIERHWDKLNPPLDPADPDPILRINALRTLVQPAAGFGEDFTFLARVQDAPLAGSRRLGRFGLRHHLVATGVIPPGPGAGGPDGVKPPDPATIEGAFKDTPPDELAATRSAVGESIASIAAIQQTLAAKLGPENAPLLEPLAKVLRQAAALLDRHLGVSAPAGSEPSEASGSERPGSAGGISGSALSGDIRSSADVLLALDKVSRYYAQSEVSSPVPVVIAAARRLVGRNFPQISRILNPDAIRVLEEIGNPPEEKKE